MGALQRSFSPAAATSDVDQLNQLAAGYFAANEAFLAASRASDAVVIGREPSDEETEAWQAASEAAEEALMSLLCFRPASDHAATLKASYCNDPRVSLQMDHGHLLILDALASNPDAAEADLCALQARWIAKEEARCSATWRKIRARNRANWTKFAKLAAPVSPKLAEFAAEMKAGNYPFDYFLTVMTADRPGARA